MVQKFYEVQVRNKDTKRVWDGIDSKAYGHYAL